MRHSTAFETRIHVISEGILASYIHELAAPAPPATVALPRDASRDEPAAFVGCTSWPRSDESFAS